jgi:hypothetical protein
VIPQAVKRAKVAATQTQKKAIRAEPKEAKKVFHIEGCINALLNTRLDED